MPWNAPAVKRDAVAGYGPEMTFCEPTLQAREEELGKVVERTGATFIHPFDDPAIIAGQGTAAMELLEDVPDLDIVMAPVGGGGLMSGTCVTVSALSPQTKLYGAEPELADDALRSIRAGRIIPSTYPDTIADGLRTSLGELTFPILHKHLEDIHTASEEGILIALRDIWERMKIIVEPSSAVPLAAMRRGPELFTGKRVGIILSGGNVELSRLKWDQ
jgi:threonine dehydratase